MPSTHPQISQIPDPHRLQYVFMSRVFRGPRNPGWVFFDGNPLNLSQPKPGVLARNLAKSMPLLYRLVPIDPKTGVPLDPEMRKVWLQHLIKERKPLENGAPASSVPLEVPTAEPAPIADAPAASPPEVPPEAPEPAATAAPQAGDVPPDPKLPPPEVEQAAPTADDAADTEDECDGDSGDEDPMDTASDSTDGGGTNAEQPKASPQELSRKAKKQRKKAAVKKLNAESVTVEKKPEDTPSAAADTLPTPRQRPLPTTSGQAAFAASLAAESSGG